MFYFIMIQVVYLYNGLVGVHGEADPMQLADFQDLLNIAQFNGGAHRPYGQFTNPGYPVKLKGNKDVSSQFNSGALGSHFGGFESFGNNAGNHGFGPAFAQGIGQATVRASDQAATLQGFRGPATLNGFEQTATQGFGQYFPHNIGQVASQKSDQDFGHKFGHTVSSENRRLSPLHLDLQGNVIPQSIFLNGNHEPVGTAHPVPTPLKKGTNSVQFPNFGNRIADTLQKSDLLSHQQHKLAVHQPVQGDQQVHLDHPVRHEQHPVHAVEDNQSEYNILYEFNPHRARGPALGREAAGPLLEAVAAVAVEERCIDKIEQVEEIEYIEKEKCEHSYDRKCHTSYSTEYSTQQEESCDESYKKECQITYSPSARNITVQVCSNPLIKDCNLSGPLECRTEYVSECWSKDDEYTVLDDVPECETVTEQKCHEELVGYSTKEKCTTWPREVCTVNKQLKKKNNPTTKCEKVPQELCGPPGCGFVSGPEVCHEQIKTIVTDLPNETCDIQPRTKCEKVSKLVPKLVPVEECVDVPKEICSKVRVPGRKVLKPITKKWCYTPTLESGLI